MKIKKQKLFKFDNSVQIIIKKDLKKQNYIIQIVDMIWITFCRWKVISRKRVQNPTLFWPYSWRIISFGFTYKSSSALRLRESTSDRFTCHHSIITLLVIMSVRRYYYNFVGFIITTTLQQSFFICTSLIIRIATL